MADDILSDILFELKLNNLMLDSLYKQNKGITELLKYTLLILMDVHQIDLAKFDSTDEEEDIGDDEDV